MKISELIKTVEVKIPEFNVSVKIKTELSWYEWVEWTNIKDEQERGKYVTEKLIVSWDIEDEEGKPLPITKEILERLPASIILPVQLKIQEVIKETLAKKKD